MTANKKGFTTRDMLRVDCVAYFAEQAYKEKLKREKIIPFRPLERQIGKRKFLERQKEDLVSVVRCKDCRHRDLFSCPLADNDFQKDDDYCSWGERREK